MSGKAKPVRLINPARTRVVLCGSGGTGAYVLQSLLRLLYSIGQANAEAEAGTNEVNHETAALAGGVLPTTLPEVLVVEGGTVSGRNVLRQGYLPQDAGRNKGLVLAERYSAAYGLGVHAYPHYLHEDTDISTLVCGGTVVIGCVDNATSRRVLDAKLRNYKDLVYIDSGNGAVPMPRPRCARRQ